MTSQNGWRRLAGALAGSAIAGALIVGFGAPTALSAPADDNTETEAPPTPTMTARRGACHHRTGTTTWVPAAVSSPT